MKQNTDTILNLLSKYYSGTSTNDEEDILREYFQSEDIPEEFDTDRRLFVSLNSEAKAPSWLKKSIERRIECKTYSSGRYYRWFTTITAAATIAIALTAGFSILQPQAPSHSEISPEEIRQITAMALNKLASTVEKGCNAVETAETKTIQTTQKAIQSLNSI